MFVLFCLEIKTVHIKEIQDLQKNQDLQDRVLADQSQEIDRLKDQKRLFDIQQGLQDAQTYKDMKHRKSDVKFRNTSRSYFHSYR